LNGVNGVVPTNGDITELLLFIVAQASIVTELKLYICALFIEKVQETINKSPSLPSPNK